MGSDSKFDYRSQDMLEQAESLQKMSESTNSQLIWIASISLLVGGIGVMNIMLVSVTERTAEIGLKKAIGAKKKRILMQFLTESAVLTSLGGLIGVISGIIMAQLISSMMQIPVSISFPAIGVAVVFSTLIGVVFGMLPAVQAANLNPMAQLISSMMQIPVSISFPAIGVAVVFSTLIGVVFGMLPAVQAANLNPIEALRRD